MDIPNTLDNVQSARSVLSSFPFIDGKMTLRYLTYNVSGLLSKLDKAAFVNYITSFDFVCFKPVLNWTNVCSPEHTSDTSTNYDSFLN